MGRNRSERGHLMIGLAIILAIMLVLSTVAVQAWTDVLRRDNEAEMIFRAEEIARALLRYQQDRGTLPTEFEQLIEEGSKGQYFIRKLYEDPLVPDGKWGLLYAAPGGGIYDPNAPQPEGPGEGSFSSPYPARDPGDVGMQSGGMSGQGGMGGPTGLGIAGVKTLCKDKPFRHYNDHEDYNLMIFSIYDTNMRAGMGGRAPGQSAQQPGQPGGQRRPGQSAFPGGQGAQRPPGRQGRPGTQAPPQRRQTPGRTGGR